MLVAGVLFMALYHLDEYAIRPGLSQPVGPLITVAGHPHAPQRRNVYLTDVYLVQLTVLQWLVAEVHPVHEQITSLSNVTGPFPASQFQNAGYLEMYDSKNAAKAVGMEAMGLHVVGVPAGVTVTGVATGAPSARALAVGDRITAVAGRRIVDECGLISALTHVVPGKPVRLTIEPARFSPSGEVTYLHARTVVSGTAASPKKPVITECPGAPRQTVVLGIAPEQAIAWHFPIAVDINTQYIGGPSAGLAMTLGVMDALSKVSITGRLKVAATGTIDPQGQVGIVGGVPEKTVAVENAGATVFLVPATQVGEALSQATSGLKVIGVSTLEQALKAIEALGGHAPVPFGSAAVTGARS